MPVPVSPTIVDLQLSQDLRFIATPIAPPLLRWLRRTPRWPANRSRYSSVGRLRDLIALAADCAHQRDRNRKPNTAPAREQRRPQRSAIAISKSINAAIVSSRKKPTRNINRDWRSWRRNTNPNATKSPPPTRRAKKRSRKNGSPSKKNSRASTTTPFGLPTAFWKSPTARPRRPSKQAPAVESSQEELNGFEVHAANLVQQYGVTLPTDVVMVEDDPTIATDTDAAFTRHRTSIDQLVSRLGKMPIANLFVGGRPYFLAVILLILTVAGVQFLSKDPVTPQWHSLEIYARADCWSFMLVLGTVLRVMATKQVRAIHTPIRQHSLQLARRWPPSSSWSTPPRSGSRICTGCRSCPECRSPVG